LGPDQSLILEHLQRRVDGAGAGLPGSPAAGADLLDHLVPVHRLLAEEHQDRRPDGAAPASPAAPAAPTRLAVLHACSLHHRAPSRPGVTVHATAAPAAFAASKSVFSVHRTVVHMWSFLSIVPVDTVSMCHRYI